MGFAYFKYYIDNLLFKQYKAVVEKNAEKNVNV
jgi:hypothetical protein